MVGSQSLARQSLATANRQSVTGRASLALSKQRQSSMGARTSRGVSLGGRPSMAGGGTRAKDPRNISDKSFMRESIRKLIRYLSEHGYDRAISPQILTAPSTKDFVHILSFLLKSAVPNFKFGAKFEDEVPTVLKTLGYPYNISKGALTAVGSPHSWPHLLAALSWLVDLLRYSEAAFERDQAEASFDSDDRDKLFFDYLQRGYSLFLSGEDDISGLDEQLGFMFESKNSASIADIASLSEANAELSRQLSALTTGDTPLEKAQLLNRDLRSDTTKFEKHIADLHEHRAKVSDKLEHEQVECKERTAELASTTGEAEAHKATIARQEMTPADVQRMNAERAHLERDLAALKAQKDELSKTLWEEELASSKRVDALEGRVQEANNRALKLHLIPGSAKNARGVSHQLELRKHLLPTAPEQLLSLDTAGVVLPGLRRVKAGFAAELQSEQDEALGAEERQTRREEEQQERLDQLTQLKASLTRLEREEKKTREAHARELEERRAETEATQDRVLKARSANGSGLLASQAELGTLQKELDDFTASSGIARERMHNQLVSALDMLMLHKEHVESHIKGLKTHCEAKMDLLAPLLAD